MEQQTLIKVGGKIVEEQDSLNLLLEEFSQIKGNKILVHGGGRTATKLVEKLNIENKMVNGRRITDKETLKVVTMVYAGLINKDIVAKLQAMDINALGLTGADMNIIRSEKRPVTDIDYGFVGDVKEVDADMLSYLLEKGIVPVIAPLTHDKKGNILNTNADTIASETAQALTKHFDVSLVFCFEKKGVLMNENDDESVIRHIDHEKFQTLTQQGIIKGGMIPKLENAFRAIEKGVKEVIITQASDIARQTGTIIN